MAVTFLAPQEPVGMGLLCQWRGTGETALSAQGLLCKHEDLVSIPRTWIKEKTKQTNKKPGMEGHTTQRWGGRDGL